MTAGDHPRKFAGCAECDAGSETWDDKRRLPQIGQTYACGRCGHEVYAYDAGGPGETIQQWRPVSDAMVINLQFFATVGDWPDSALSELYAQGLERIEAIDYHMVKKEGLTQTDWAEARGVDQSTVSENISKAKRKLEC